MNPSVDSVAGIDVGNDPVLLFVKWVVVVFILLSAGGIPALTYYRKWKQLSAENAKDSATTTLYDNMAERIRQNTDDIKDLVREKNRWFEEATRLKAEAEVMHGKLHMLEESEITIKGLVRKLDDYETVISDQRKRMDQKDEILRKRDQEIRDLLKDLMNLKESMHKLESKLMIDEATFCAGCKYRLSAEVEV